MKLNMLKSKIVFLLIAGTALSGMHIQAMELEKSNNNAEFHPADIENGLNSNAHIFCRRENYLAPLIHAGVCGAVGRYGPDIAQAVLPQITSNPLAHTLIPPTIKFGGIGLAGHFALKACGKKYTDFVNPQLLQNTIIDASKLAPLALCHPTVAQLAAHYCTSVASSYISKDNMEIVNKYAVPTIITAGALGALYLNRNTVFNKQTWNNIIEVCKDPKEKGWNKVKQVCKDVRPCLWMAPALCAYNSQALKNCAMAYLPGAGSKLHSDCGKVLNAAICVGGLGTAGYLFATETLEIPTVKYFTRKFEKLSPHIKQINNDLQDLKDKVESTKLKAENLRKGQEEQKKELEKYKEQIDNNTQENSKITKKIEDNQALSKDEINALERAYTLISEQVQKINLSAGQLKTELDQITKEQADYVEALKSSIEERDKKLLTEIDQENQKFQSQIAELKKILEDKETLKNEMIDKLNIIANLHNQALSRLQNTDKLLDEVLLALKVNPNDPLFSSEFSKSSDFEKK
jgi:hypothetical protein